jgi:hypothetical protein
VLENMGGQVKPENTSLRKFNPPWGCLQSRVWVRNMLFHPSAARILPEEGGQKTFFESHRGQSAFFFHQSGKVKS